MPEALEQVPARQGVLALLAGILSFFVLEKLVIWRHCHEGDDECATHSRAASLVIVGDAFHTFIDGAIIGAAVLTSAPLGLSTALAAATHEIPQELGDFGVLLHAGYTPRRALLLNVASGAAGIVGTVVVYTAASHLPTALPYMLAFAAGGFLYVAMADLIPGLHSHHQSRHPFRQTLLICAGIATMLLRVATAEPRRPSTRVDTDRAIRRAGSKSNEQAPAACGTSFDLWTARRSRRETPNDGSTDDGQMHRPPGVVMRKIIARFALVSALDSRTRPARVRRRRRVASAAPTSPSSRTCRTRCSATSTSPCSTTSRRRSRTASSRSPAT